MLCFRADAALREIGRHAPRRWPRSRRRSPRAGSISARCGSAPPSPAAPKVSFDYAVMEKTDRAVVVAADFAWSDVGDWQEVWALSAKDARRGRARGRRVARIDVATATSARRGPAGLRDRRRGAVGDRHRRRAAGRAARPQPRRSRAGRRSRGRRAGRRRRTPARVHRPWGWYQTMDLGDALPGEAHPGDARARSSRCRSTTTAPSTGWWCAAPPR